MESQAGHQKPYSLRMFKIEQLQYETLQTDTQVYTMLITAI